MNKVITDWGRENDIENRTFETLYELVEHTLDCGFCKLDDELEVTGYCRDEWSIENESVSILERFIESLDEDTGADCYTEPSKKMIEASKVFVETVIAEYPRYKLEEVETKIIKVADYI